VICGNSLKEPDEEDLIRRTAKNQFGTEMIQYDPKPLRALDEIINVVASSMNVDMMPGNSDPASRMLPQEPLHKALFSKARCYSSFSTVTNPYEFTCNGIRYLNT
jgi:DNA polymerase delta subunit 2